MKRASALLLFLTLAAAPAAQAATVTTTISRTPPLYPFAYPYPPSLCPTASFQICGLNFTAPQGNLGNSITFTLPDRFATTLFNAQCVSDNGQIYYRLGDTPSCALKTCRPQMARLCGDDFPVGEESHVGDIVRLSIMPDRLATAAEPPLLGARCDVVDGVATYEVTGADNLSCNIFACPPVTLAACDSAVSVPRPGNLGASFYARTDTGKQVEIQCLGSNGLAPQYKIIDQQCN